MVPYWIPLPRCATRTFRYWASILEGWDFWPALAEELHIAVQSLVKRTILIDKRSLIHLDASKPLFGDVPYGLNEFAIHKTDTSSMIKFTRT